MSPLKGSLITCLVSNQRGFLVGAVNLQFCLQMGNAAPYLCLASIQILHFFVNQLKGVQRPAAFAIVCCCFCEFRKIRYSGSCGEQVIDFAQSMLVFVLPLNLSSEFGYSARNSQISSKKIQVCWLFNQNMQHFICLA